MPDEDNRFLTLEEAEAARAGIRARIEGAETDNPLSDAEIERLAREPRKAAAKGGRRKARPAPGDWRGELETDERKRVVANLANVMIAMREAPELKEAFAYNEMKMEDVLRLPLPIVEGAPAKAEARLPRMVTDVDARQVQEWLQVNDIPRIAIQTVQQAISLRARDFRFHPVRDYLDGLRWDGRPRVDKWLSYYFGAEPSPYVSAVGRHFLIAMIARITRPGCKFDYMLILEGEQGLQKSTALRILAGEDEWFSDSLPDIKLGKEVSEHIRGKWILELSELTSIRKTEVEELKSFVSRQIEQYRPSYGRREVVEPRQCVFVGTTNAKEYLQDKTGNRRFWPIVTHSIDLEALRHDRDQLLAEATTLYRSGAPWWPTHDFEKAHFAPEQEKRRKIDEWETPIRRYLSGRDETTVGDIGHEALQLATGRIGTAEQNRITDLLDLIGWERGKRRENGRPWVRKTTSEARADDERANPADAHDAHDAP